MGELYFRQLNGTLTTIDGKIGAAQSLTGSPGGAYFTYSSDTTLASNSNVKVPTEAAVKGYIDGKVNGIDVPDSHKVFVDKTAGNNTTGVIGNMLHPFLTYTGAASSLTGLGDDNQYVFKFNPEQHTENISILPWTWIIGDFSPSNMILGKLTANSIFSTVNGNSGLKNIQLYNVGNQVLNIDLYAIGGFDLSRWYIEDCIIGGDNNYNITLKGRGLSDTFNLLNVTVDEHIHCDGGTYNFTGLNSDHQVVIYSTNVNATATIIGCKISDAVIVSSSTNIASVRIINSFIGGLSINDTGSIVYIDSASLYGVNVTYSNGATSSQLVILDVPYQEAITVASFAQTSFTTSYNIKSMNSIIYKGINYTLANGDFSYSGTTITWLNSAISSLFNIGDKLIVTYYR